MFGWEEAKALFLREFPSRQDRVGAGQGAGPRGGSDSGYSPGWWFPPAVIWELGRALPSRSGASPAALQPWRGDAEPQPAGLTGVPALGAHHGASPGSAPSRGMAQRSVTQRGPVFWLLLILKPLPGDAARARAAPSSHASGEGVRSGLCVLSQCSRVSVPALPSPEVPGSN